MKLKYTWIPFLLSLIIVLPLRLYQVINTGGQLFGIDLNDNFLTGVFIYIMMFFSLIIICMSLFSKKSHETINIHKNNLIGSSLFLISLSTIFEAIRDIIYSGSVNAGGSAMQAVVLLVTALAAGAAFFIMGMCYMQGKNLFAKMPFLMMFPTIWLTCKLGISFMNNRAISNRSPEMIAILANAFLTLFFLYNARIYILDENNNVVKKLYAFGLPAVIFSIVYALPNIYQFIFNYQYYTKTLEVSSITMILMSLYIILMLIYRMIGLDEVSEVSDDYEQDTYQAYGSPRAEESMIRKNKS